MGFLLGRFLVVCGGGLDGNLATDGAEALESALVAVEGDCLDAPVAADCGLGAPVVGTTDCLIAVFGFTAFFFGTPPLTGPSAAIEF